MNSRNVIIVFSVALCMLILISYIQHLIIRDYKKENELLQEANKQQIILNQGINDEKNKLQESQNIIAKDLESGINEYNKILDTL